MKNTRKGLLFAFLVCAGLSGMSQEKGHYLSVKGSLGMATLDYHLKEGDIKKNLGFGGEIGYSYFFSKHWGIGTGVGVSFFNSDVNLTSKGLNLGQFRDSENDLYTASVRLRDLTENHKAIFLEVPLTLQFQAKFGEKQAFGIYADAGARLQVPVSSKYEVTDGVISREGYYPDWNITLFDMPEHGYGTTDIPREKGDAELKTGVALTAGLGFLFGLGERVDLFLGGRFDYGLMDIKKNNDGDVVYVDGSEVKYRNVLASNESGKVLPIVVKGELGVRFRLGGPSAERREVTTYIPLTPDMMEDEYIIITREIIVEPVRDVTPVRTVVETPTKSKAEIQQELSTPIDHYVINVTELNSVQRRLLDNDIQVLKDNPDVRVRLEGNTCDIGSDEVNERIGRERAENVKDYLVQQGISSSRITVVSNGKRKPVVPNTSETNRKENRRVSFIVQ